MLQVIECFNFTCVSATALCNKYLVICFHVSNNCWVDLLHVGFVSDQFPFSRHTLDSGPAKEYMSWHVYSAVVTAPSVLYVTFPCTGPVCNSHVTVVFQIKKTGFITMIYIIVILLRNKTTNIRLLMLIHVHWHIKEHSCDNIHNIKLLWKWLI